MHKNILHCNELGYVSQCDCCNDIHLCIGNLALSLSRTDFFLFKKNFFELNDLTALRLHKNSKEPRFLFVTSFSDLSLSLSKSEYKLCCDLLQVSQVLLELRKGITH